MKQPFIWFALICASLQLQAQTTKKIVLSTFNSTIEDSQPGSLVPTTTFGDAEWGNPYAWTIGGQVNITRPYIKFDFTSIPANATILEAKMLLFWDKDYPGVNGQHAGDNGFYISRVTSTWNESTLTWLNQPTVSNTNRVTVQPSSDTRQNYCLDITQLTQDIINSGVNYGFQMRLITEDVYRNVALASSEHKDCSRHPVMQITYTDAIVPPPPPPPAVTCADNLLKNPGFEQGLNNWAGSGFVAGTIANSGAAGTSMCVSGGIIRQTIPAQAGLMYQFTGFGRLDNGTSNPYMALKFLNSSWVPIHTVHFNPQLNTQFGKFTLPATLAPVGTAWVEVMVLHKGGTGCLHLDDMCLSNTVQLVSPNGNNTQNEQAQNLAEIPEGQYLIFPNPAVDGAMIEGLQPDVPTKIEIMNQAGMVLKTDEILTPSKSFELDLKGISSGIYFVRIAQMNKRANVEQLVIMRE